MNHSEKFDQTCGNCRFFAAYHSEDPEEMVTGICRRYPPKNGGQQELEDGSIGALTQEYPEMEEHCWCCGEWRDIIA